MSRGPRTAETSAAGLPRLAPAQRAEGDLPRGNIPQPRVGDWLAECSDRLGSLQLGHTSALELLRRELPRLLGIPEAELDAESVAHIARDSPQSTSGERIVVTSIHAPVYFAERDKLLREMLVQLPMHGVGVILGFASNAELADQMSLVPGFGLTMSSEDGSISFADYRCRSEANGEHLCMTIFRCDPIADFDATLRGRMPSLEYVQPDEQVASWLGVSNDVRAIARSLIYRGIIRPLPDASLYHIGVHPLFLDGDVVAAETARTTDENMIPRCVRVGIVADMIAVEEGRGVVRTVAELAEAFQTTSERVDSVISGMRQDVRERHAKLLTVREETPDGQVVNMRFPEHTPPQQPRKEKSSAPSKRTRKKKSDG